jgi:Ca2+/Na+ antiporter
MKSTPDKPQVAVPVCALLLLAALPVREVGPWAMLWTAPSILAAAMLIAWAAESAQFFIAQGFALAILAWLQTLPEFAVEAVYALRQDVPMLLAGLTGALRLLTGLGWPLIYATAALAHRRRHGKPLRAIHLTDEHCVEVVGLLVCMAYAAVIWWKASLNLFDAAVLIAIYVAYLWLLSKQPVQHEEGIQDLEWIPRSIVLAAKPVRVAAIIGLFVTGGAVIYFVSEPFLDSLQAVSLSLGVGAVPGGRAVLDQHGAGVVGGGGAVRAVCDPIRALAGEARTGNYRNAGFGDPLARHDCLSGLGGGRDRANVAGPQEAGGASAVRGDVEGEISF